MIFITLVAVMAASLLLGFCCEVFGLDLGSASWLTNWVSSPIALLLGLVFALSFGKTFPDFTKVMSKKL